MDDYSTKIKSSAEHLIQNEFPEKALELDRLVSSSALSFNEINKVRQNTHFPTAEEIVAHLTNGTGSSSSNLRQEQEATNNNGIKSNRKRRDESNEENSSTSFNGLVPSNSLLSTLEDQIKPFIFHFLDSVAIIKLWIQLMIPKIEDGNNFGVSVQEESLAEIRTLETDVTQYLDLTSKYLISRAELIKKVVKYPHVEDYRRSVQSLDEKQFVSIRFIALELRNHYTSVHDLLMKNLDKITKPRSAQIHSLY